jgi:Ca-activated chloride channel family protein
MTFAAPFAFAFGLMYCLLRLLPTRRAVQSVPCGNAAFFSRLPTSARVRLRTPVLSALEAITIVTLTLAAARPQKLTIIDQPNVGRNIMLVVDVSRSMAAEDFPTSFGKTSRMEGVKTVVAEYVRSRHNDRVGLIVFGNTAYLQSPLTTDTQLVEGLVSSLQPGMAGDGTAIGDGLGLALKRLKDIKDSSRAIILMTDGVNTAGQVSPLKAAAIAKDVGVQVHTIGIGTGKAAVGQPGFGGFLGAHSQMADFDETTLKEMANLTGGVYFNATSLDGFKDVYRQIDKLSETEEQQPQKPIVEELFAPCAVIALLALIASLSLRASYFRRVP